MILRHGRREHHQQRELQKQNHLQRDQNKDKAGQLRIIFYTDPLCCWSWAFENVWRDFIDSHGKHFSYTYVMGGMIPDWHTYRDEMNAVTRPAQMGPLWMHASEVTHVPMRYSIWHEDAPASSYPSCIAVKTASLQSQLAEELYLLNVRKVLMLDGKNIAKTSVLADVARQIDGPDFSFEQFKQDWDTGLGRDAFKADIQKTRQHNIGRFPTLVFQNEKGDGIMMVGYRPYDVLLQAFDKFWDVVKG